MDLFNRKRSIFSEQISVKLYNTLRHHRVGDFAEPGNIRAYYKIICHAILSGRTADIAVDSLHDFMQFSIYFIKCPGQTLRILAHLQCGCGHTTSVGRLTRSKKNLCRTQVEDILYEKQTCQ